MAMETHLLPLSQAILSLWFVYLDKEIMLYDRCLIRLAFCKDYNSNALILLETLSFLLSKSRSFAAISAII